MQESPNLSITLRQTTEYCFDSDSGHAERRTCNLISQAMTHTSILAIFLPLVLGIIAAIL